MKTKEKAVSVIETRADQRKDINAKLASAQLEQETLQLKRLQRGIELYEFMSISNRLNVLSTIIDIQNKKLFNLSCGKSALGDSTPGKEVSSNRRWF